MRGAYKPPGRMSAKAANWSIPRKRWRPVGQLCQRFASGPIAVAIEQSRGALVFMGIVVFDDVAYPAVRKLCRYITTNRAYEVVGGDNRPASGQRRIAEWVARFARLSRFCHPSLICADSRLGINASYVALRKTSDDVLGNGQNRTRRWDQHTDF